MARESMKILISATCFYNINQYKSNGLTEPSVIKVLVRYKDLRKSLSLAINYVQAARAASSQVLLVAYFRIYFL
jgi:hypothetical protein